MPPYSLDFDRYQRFAFTAGLIEELAEAEDLRVLDVGSWDNRLADFLPQHQVTPWEGVVSRDKGGLPFDDGSVEVAVALDVLEHVPAGDRRFFISELARVASSACVLGFPIAAAAAAEEFVLGITGSPWLAEHQEHGLPEPAEVEAVLGELGLDYIRHPNACLPSWTAMMLLMYGVQDLELRGEISAFFNRHFYKLENREPAYRYIYLCRQRQASAG